jgi:hypothetical protein
MGSAEPVIAFATRTFEPPGLEIRVNFGMFAGREATPAEIEELASVLRIEVHAEALPNGEDEVLELRGRVLEAAERWVNECVEDRRGGLSDAPD